MEATLINETLAFLQTQPHVEHRLGCPLHKRLASDVAERGGYDCNLVVPKLTDQALEYHSYWATIFWEKGAESPVETCTVYTSIRAPIGLVLYSRSGLRHGRPSAPLLGYELSTEVHADVTPAPGWESFHQWLRGKLQAEGVTVSEPQHLLAETVGGFSCLLPELPEPRNLFLVLFHSGLDYEF